MNRIRLHIVGLLLGLVCLATSAPAPLRHHGHSPALRDMAWIQLDDDEEREAEEAVVEDGEAGASRPDRRRARA